jgi:putative peptidoglycan lipid II flippase
MAAAYTLSYTVGLLRTAVLLRRRLEGRMDGRRLCRVYGKLAASSAAAGTLGWLVARCCSAGVAAGAWAPVLALAAGGVTMALLFVLLARVLKISELRSLPGLR